MTCLNPISPSENIFVQTRLVCAGPRLGIEGRNMELVKKRIPCCSGNLEFSNANDSKKNRKFWYGRNFLNIEYTKVIHFFSTFCWWELPDWVVCSWVWPECSEWVWTWDNKDPRWWTQWGGCQIQYWTKNRIRMRCNDILRWWRQNWIRVPICNKIEVNVDPIARWEIV